MGQVTQNDIIANIATLLNFEQGSSQAYTINLYRNVVGTLLKSKNATSITVSIVDDSGAVLDIFSDIPGASTLSLAISTANFSDISFTIPATSSAYYPNGKIYAKISLIYKNFYPNGITYNLPNLELGTIALSARGSLGLTATSAALLEPSYTIESLTGTDNPGLGGKAVIDSGTPSAITLIKLSNLDANGLRLSELENFLTKLAAEGARGRLKIINKSHTSLYALYKIISFSRIDSYAGTSGTDTEDNDSIKINLVFEMTSSGSIATQTLFQVGNVISYEADSQGILLEDIPIWTNEDVDKTSSNTSGNYAQTGIVLTSKPHASGTVVVDVNGLRASIGDGVRTKECYFSRDTGTTVLALNVLALGNQLIWNGVIAGYELDATDKIDILYEK